MLFFLKENICGSNATQSAALQAQKKKGKRALLFASFPWTAANAGITVEAALALPVFLLSLWWFPFSLVIMGTQVHIQHALEQAAMELARYEYVEQTFLEEITLPVELPAGLKALAGDAYGYFRVTSLLGQDNIKSSCIKNGGLVVLDCGEEEFIELTAYYQVEIPFFTGGKTLTMCQRSRRRAWTGKKELLVYITAKGSVYHLYRDCTYIHHNPRGVSLDTIDRQQNSAGSGYSPCRLCCKNGVSGTVYITTEGDKYHSSAACGGIYKEVIAIPITEVGQRPPCSRCEKR